MGKHSIEKKKNDKKVLYICIFIIIIALMICFGIILDRNNIIKTNKQNKISSQIPDYTIQSKTIEGEKLVIKSNSDYNKYIEYIFEENVLSKVNIYQQFENEELYKTKKNKYQQQENINLIKFDDNRFVLEIGKTNFGTDEGLTYEQVYDKYVVQIIGSYEVVE